MELLHNLDTDCIKKFGRTSAERDCQKWVVWKKEKYYYYYY